MALLLAGKACLLLLLLPLYGGHRVQELLVAPALLHLLLILVQLAADGGHGGIQPLDLHQLHHQAAMMSVLDLGLLLGIIGILGVKQRCFYLPCWSPISPPPCNDLHQN